MGLERKLQVAVGEEDIPLQPADRKGGVQDRARRDHYVHAITISRPFPGPTAVRLQLRAPGVKS
jgi:hypothetical protein